MALPKPLLSLLLEYKDYTPNGIIKDIRANRSIRNVSKNNQRQSKIKVGFIVQMPEIWDKIAPVYDAMMSNSIFEVDLIIIPPYNQASKKIEKHYDRSNYFITHYSSYILAYQCNNWISIKDKNYDYVFVQRPYDQYLPSGFKSSELVTFTKVCYIPYGFGGSDVFDAVSAKKEFFRNVYFVFLESDYMTGVFKKKFKFPSEKRNHKIINSGFPALAPYFSFPQLSDYHTFTWTPRWSFDSSIGGSNFLKYKDTFLNVAENHPEKKFIFRPHPLMFGEILEKGLMSSNEISLYLEKLSQLGVIYDRDTPLADTLEQTDVLITDYSSIIIQFFVTGRPIIYCESCIKLNSTYQELKKGMYIVTSEDNYYSYVEKIMRGEDSTKNVRNRIIGDMFNNHRDATMNIINEIIKDHGERN